MNLAPGIQRKSEAACDLAPPRGCKLVGCFLALLLGACSADLPSETTDGEGGAAGAIAAGGSGGEVGGQGGMTPGCEPECGAGAWCDVETLSCHCEEGYYGSDPEAGCEPVPVPTGFIGSPCMSDTDCEYPGAVCQPDAEGYPDGHCSQSCDKYCPDEPGFPATFCIQPPSNDSGFCHSRCDMQVYPHTAGCRPGYQCVIEPRYAEVATVRPVCVPSSWLGGDPCADRGNLTGDDDCYFELVSFGDKSVEALSRKILAGTATKAHALAFLDANFAASQQFITGVLGKTIHDNFTSGHSQRKPMRGMIVHYTAAQRENGTIGYFVSASPHASTHFVIGSERNGLIVQIFSHAHRTWHAGSMYNVDRFGVDFANAGYLKPDGSGWKDYADRSYTMWLPLHGDQPVKVTGGIPGAESKYATSEHWQPYTYYQTLSFVMLGRALHLVYGLEEDAVERHGDVAASRVDPGPQLPLTYLKALVFNDVDLMQLPWLAAYKVEADWIEQHPEAR